MGIRALTKACATLATLTMLAIGTLTFFGCPPPEWRDIKFLTDKQMSQKLTLVFPDKVATMTLSGASRLDDSFIVRIYVEVTYNAEASDFRWNPSVLSVEANGVRLHSTEAVMQEHRPDAGTNSERIGPTPYLSFFEFKADPAEATQYNNKGTRIPVSIGIAFDGFAYFRGQPIVLDTLWAEASY